MIPKLIFFPNQQQDDKLVATLIILNYIYWFKS